MTRQRETSGCARRRSTRRCRCVRAISIWLSDPRLLTPRPFRRGASFIFAGEPLMSDDFEVRLELAPTCAAVQLRSGLRVVLFGTGQAATIARGVALRRTWNIVYCVDNDRTRWGSRFGDRDVR